jgi:hypothetical protein
MRKTTHNTALTNKKRVISTIGQGGRPDILKWRIYLKTSKDVE